MDLCEIKARLFCKVLRQPGRNLVSKNHRKKEKSGGNESKLRKISTKTVAVEQSSTTLNGEQGSYFQKARSRCVIFPALYSLKPLCRSSINTRFK